MILLVVMAAVLFLASLSWKKLMPAALHVTAPDKAGSQGGVSLDAPPASGNSGAGQAPIQSSLSETKKKTAAHAEQVEKALEEP